MSRLMVPVLVALIAISTITLARGQEAAQPASAGAVSAAGADEVSQANPRS